MSFCSAIFKFVAVLLLSHRELRVHAISIEGEMVAKGGGVEEEKQETAMERLGAAWDCTTFYFT